MNPEHLTNLSSENYEETMESSLEDARKNMRSWLFADNIRRSVVLGPVPMMTKMGASNCWGEDPVHLLPVVFEELAKLVLSSLEKLENKVETASTKPSRASGGGRDWHDRRGGQWGRGGGGWAGYGGRAGFGNRVRYAY